MFKKCTFITLFSLNERIKHIQTLISVYTYILCHNLLIGIVNFRFGNEWIMVRTYYLIYAKFEAQIYTKPIKEMRLFELGTNLIIRRTNLFGAEQGNLYKEINLLFNQRNIEL